MKDCSRGVLCFSLGSRPVSEYGAAPPGMTVGGSAGMTEGWRGKDGLFTLTLGPPLNLPLGGGGRWLEGEGI